MQGTMKILGPNGDTAVMWDTEDKASVDEAEERFNELMRRNMIGFALQTAVKPNSGDGAEATKIDKFDPDAHEIVVMQPLVGG